MRGLIPFCLIAGLAGCAVAPDYYVQAAGGQLELWQKSRPIDALLADAATPRELRARLELAQQIRAFAANALDLPVGDNFHAYAELGRPYVVWNVFASPPLSVRPREWCVPVAGCIGYLGYFSEAGARAHAQRLRADGLDVHVGGVPAYSTLGWFDDPLLSTFIRWPETELARLIFHESAHKIVYVKDDTTFNESFATAVEEAGIEAWMAQPGKGALRGDFERAQRMRADFADLVMRHRGALEALYASPLPEAGKRQGKAAIIATLRAEYRALRDGPWDGYAGYDRWFGQEINNATLASVGLYRGLVPAFRALLAQQGGDLPRFYAEVRRLAALPAAERRVALEAAALPPVAGR